MTLENLYMHGYSIIPFFDAFLKKNVFGIIENEPGIPFETLSEKLAANTGPFKAALEAFETLSWVQNRDNRYYLTKNFPKEIKIPSFIISSYEIPFSNPNALYELFKHNDISMITQPLGKGSIFSTLLDGSFLLPLLFHIKIDNLCCIDSVILDLLANKGVITHNESKLTQLGDHLFKSIKKCGVTLSYRPLFALATKLLFGDWREVAQTIQNDSHVDRTLNVIGSGAQHQIFFSDMVNLINEAIANNRFNNRSLTIVDMGCGDGTLLKYCHDSIKYEGRINLVGVDYSVAALKQTQDRLAGIPHDTFRGDVAYPELLTHDLKGLGHEELNTLLHIRSFLDHDRPYIPPKGKLVQRQSHCCYVDGDGSLRSSAEVTQSLVEYFKKWSNEIGAYGLITLEVFSLPTYIKSKYFEISESFHFDLYHSLSMQLLVEANVYLLCAAEAGLFPDMSTFKKYPLLSPFTRISLQHFFKRDFTIRSLTEFHSLEESMIKGVTKARSGLQEDFPHGQFVLEKNKAVLAVLLTRRVDSSFIHMESGSILELQQLYWLEGCHEYALELMSFVILNGLVMSGVKQVISPIELLHIFADKCDNAFSYTEKLIKESSYAVFDYTQVTSKFGFWQRENPKF